jgi:hypothetical protein
MLWGWLSSASPYYGGFAVFIFCQLFFGGMVMPVATGIMLNQVP